MRKMLSLIAAAALVAAPLAFAEDAATNPNDVMQTAPGQQVADASSSEATPASEAMPAAEPTAEPAKAAPHHKHKGKHHHHKHHAAGNTDMATPATSQ